MDFKPAEIFFCGICSSANRNAINFKYKNPPGFLTFFNSGACLSAKQDYIIFQLGTFLYSLFLPLIRPM